MKRPWLLWLAFGLCLATVLAAMGWVSAVAVNGERTERQANRMAAEQERIRLSLWRMDSALTPLIAQESGRPYFTYTAFHPMDRAYTRMFAELEPDDILVPSPLLTYRSPMIVIHFQLLPSGEIASPQAPTGNQRDLAETGYVTHAQIEECRKQMLALKDALQYDRLLAMLPQAEEPPRVAVRTPAVAIRDLAVAVQQKKFNDVEMSRRINNVYNADNFNNGQFQLSQAAQGQSQKNLAPAMTVREGPIKALWVGPRLILAQRVSIAGKDYIQGCWLDWRRIRQSLLAEAGDLLPHADLQKAIEPVSSGCRLAALPVTLVPGPVPYDLPGEGSPVKRSLLIAWICLLLGAAAVGSVLQGAMTLSRRRGAFVSAVTHELRTPLTTFRLYSDLLAADAIADPLERKRCLLELQQESARLSHLVENVLSWAKLSGPRHGKGAQSMTLGEVLDRSSDRLSARARQAGMTLTLTAPDTSRKTVLNINLSSVEQILMNLVDNACKYAAQSDDKTIHVEAAAGRQISIRVRDHGPGISMQQARGLFRAFRKSAHEAANSAPGVGLGLALSRRLARDMKGDLQMDNSVTHGACFILTLPAGNDEP